MTGDYMRSVYKQKGSAEMFFQYAKENAIQVPEPFKRVITPLMCRDNAGCPIPFSVHFTEWEPGRQVDMHCHEDAMEAMLCLSGSAQAMIDGEWVDFVPGSMIVADKKEAHCIRNDGDEKLEVLCIFSPPVSAEDLRERAFAAVQKAESVHQ